MAAETDAADPGGASLMRQAGPLIAARLFTAILTLSIPLVLARVLPLAEYGTYKQLFLIALTLSSILPLGVGQSLYYFIPRTTHRRVYFGQTLLFLLAAGGVAAVGLFAAMPRVAAAFENPGLLDHRLLLALYTGFTVAASPLELSMTSQGQTRRSALTYLVWDSARAAAFVVPATTGRGLGAMMTTLTLLAALRLVAAWAVMLGGKRGPLLDRRLFAGQLAYAFPFGMAMLVAIPQQYAHQYVVASTVGPALFAIYAAGCFDPPFVDLLYTPTGEVLMVRLGALEKAGRAGESVAVFREAAGHLARYLLPGVVFLWAIAPDFVVAVFGERFAASATIFRVWLLAIPFGIFPMDAALRARNETRHLFRAYVVKAVATVPLVWAGVSRFGILGGVGSYVAAELVGKAMLAARLPRALADAGVRPPLQALVPWGEISRAGIGGTLAAIAGVAVLRAAPALEAPGAAATALYRFVPLAIAGLVGGAIYVAVLWMTGVRPAAALAAIRSRRPAGAP
ncbi:MULTISPECIES: oligosaccharide flippase family protein [unclassified Anaeromyxobacter]|uniref:oligosaccharide flippase family protein n=1 Tax=unclassified Anaeromyxobacter TaxID=2620896 RepID=UPI001F5960EB|nr:MULTISPECIES: oligosaccharide flippase family protein [unclassified Anaeromyxobacter]